MPVTEKGITPDLIINPNAIPSRMTIGQLIECLLGKVGAINGHECDGTSFTRVDIESIKDELEKHGYDRNGGEYMRNGMTGKKMQSMIFVGPTYYQRLKHLVLDKCHCLTMDHEVLTASGWKRYPKITMNDKIATLKDNELVYEHPIKLLSYPDYKGEMYHIKSQSIDLNVTGNHRMWTSAPDCSHEQIKWQPYDFEVAKNIIGKYRKYKKNAIWNAPDYQIPSEYNNGKQIVNMDAWIHSFGIQIDMECNEHNKHLPEWVWSLSNRQAILLMDSMTHRDDTYYTTSECFADDVMRLCLHCGWSCDVNITVHAGDKSFIEEKEIISSSDVFRLDISKTDNSPEVNNANIQSDQEETLNIEKCPVFCLQVPSEVFYVRRNGKGCWTGNSRAYGPKTLLLHQPSEGRARGGGMRIGEMERDALIAHGISKYIKEKLMDTSDVYTTYVCDECGLFAQRLQKNENKVYPTNRDVYYCPACNNKTHISKIVIPYAFKLLVQELMSMCIAPRIHCANDKYTN